jgi:phosphatidyl-myo-inositol alpha-mannosyltransferase
MRVALVSPYDIDVPGGVQSHVLHLADALRRFGDDVFVVAPGQRSRGGIRTVGGSVRIPFNDSVAPIALGPGTLRRTRAVLGEIAPDIVHVHEPAVPFVSVAAVSSDVAPIVATFHAWSDRDRAYRLARPALRRLLRGLAARVAVSPAAAAYHAAALGLPEGAFDVIPNGVDVARFATAQPFAAMREQECLLFVGRLEPRKGLEQFLHAVTILKATRPHLRAYVVGDGPERDRCQSLLPARLRSDVVFLGRVENEELPRFFTSCDLFVSPALGGESFGIVLIEAMAAGRPVVASNIPGYASVITDGVNGRLVPPRDPDALAAAIGALLDNPNLAAALAAEAVRGVQRYDWATVAGDLRRVYARVLGNPRTAR